MEEDRPLVDMRSEVVPGGPNQMSNAASEAAEPAASIASRRRKCARSKSGEA